jgi:hypothetical protein
MSPKDMSLEDLPPGEMSPEALLARVLYRDGLMLVIDKPAGMPVHRGPKGGGSLEDHFDALRYGLPRPPAGSGRFRGAALHRSRGGDNLQLQTRIFRVLLQENRLPLQIMPRKGEHSPRQEDGGA